MRGVFKEVKEVKEVKEKTNRRWFWMYLGVSFLYFNWRLWFTIPMNSGWISVICGGLLLAAESVGMFEFMIHFMNMSRVMIPETPKVEKEEEYPEVDVFIATYNEPMRLLYKTIVAAQNMRYPDPQKVHIYLLDDGNRETAKRLCQHLGITHLTRETNEHAKAGNINEALKKTSSPYVVTFDADMMPLEDFLMETIPFFIQNETQRNQEYLEKGRALTAPLGFIQTPQAFYNPDVFQHYLFLEKEIPNEQDYFYRSVQLGKNRSNSVIYAGSNTVISREALTSIGGFVTGIITEDIATGLSLQKAGYRSLAIDTVLATGLSPDDLRTIVKQRKRWGRGCIQTFKRFNPFLVSGLTWAQRLNYFDSLCYWYGSVKRFIFILSPILFSVFGVRIVDAQVSHILMFWIPMTLLMKKMFQLHSKDIRNAVWSDIYETILMPSLMGAILLETIGLKQKRFEVTEKETLDRVTKREKLRFAMPHLLLLGLCFYGILTSITQLFTPQWSAYVMVAIWLGINFYNLVMAIFFALGRPLHPNYHLDGIEGDLFEGDQLVGKVIALSEEELVFDSSLSQETLEKVVSLKLVANEQVIPFKGTKLEEMDSGEGRWIRMAIKVDSEADYQRLLSILYNRQPMLPQTIKKQSRFYYVKKNTYDRWRIYRALKELSPTMVKLKMGSDKK